MLGGAGNTAANLVSLGSRVTLLGLRRPRHQRRSPARGAPPPRASSCSVLDDGRATSRKTRGRRQQQQMVRLDYEDTRPLDAATGKQGAQPGAVALPDVDVLIISDYAKGLLTEGLRQGIISAAKRQQTRRHRSASESRSVLSAPATT